MKTTKSPILKFQDISLAFNKKVILKDFNFSISKGQKVVIFGKSGTGKSTLLRLILGFQSPDSGNIFCLQKKISPQNIQEIRSRIAYVDQDVMMGEGRVVDIIKEYFSFKSNSSLSFSPDSLVSKMKSFDLEENLLQKDLAQLSGGERQRMALVVALSLKRPILVLDEVTSALDPQSKDIVISQLLKQKDQTLIVVTHDKQWQKQKSVNIFDFKDKTWVR